MKAKCRHCECRIDPERECLTCGNKLRDQCVACHEEVAHDVIRNMNIHIVGSRGGARDDHDAFAKANDQ